MPDYFEFFGLERKLSLDLDDLQRRFYRLSRELHPDRYTRATPAERARALEASAVLNDAYRTLRDPVLRAEYLLGTDSMTPELMEEIFEWNEAPGDGTTLRARVAELDARLAELFREHDTGNAVASEIRASVAARKALAKLLAAETQRTLR
jgi:DnaJ-domain-containing protein 1